MRADQQAIIDAMNERENLRQSLADVLAFARIKWGNLDTDATKVFERAESLLGP